MCSSCIIGDISNIFLTILSSQYFISGRTQERPNQIFWGAPGSARAHPGAPGKIRNMTNLSTIESILKHEPGKSEFSICFKN